MYAGEQRCVGICSSRADKSQCTHKAFFEGQLCKRHARNIKNCPLLPENPDKDQLSLAKDVWNAARVLVVAEQNKRAKRRGEVVCTKLKMRHPPEHIDGYRKVFPNYRHANRADGYGCATLSPMSMGPIKHGQPGLPDAQNLENLHQANKVFMSEVNPDGDMSAG
jgi:hypothetical protein